MATLEKIRKKSALLFTIIIVALLAFILGDFLTSGRSFFGHGTTMAKTAGQSIDYNKVSERVEQLSQQAQAQGQNPDSEALRQMAIQQLLTQALINQEIADLGITVSDSEISNGMTGAVPHPAVQQFIYQISQSLGLQNISGEAVFDAVSNPAKYGISDQQTAQQLRALWAQQEQQLEEAIKYQKFTDLISGLYSANPVDAEARTADMNTTSHISYVAKDFTSLPDTDFNVSDDEIKAEWSKNREMYRIAEPGRAINYIIVPIQPSAEDIRRYEAEAANAIATLRTDSTGVNSLQGNTAFVTNRVSTPMRDVQNPILRSYLDTARVGQVEQLVHNGQGYTFAKLIGKKNEVDSVRISFALFADTDSRDSVMAKVNSGELTFAKFLEENPGVGQDSIWDRMVGTDTPAALASKIINAPINEFISFDDSIMTPNGNYEQRHMAVKVITRRAPVPVYDVAIVQYDTEASQETINKLNSDLRKYVSDNATAEAFKKNAAAAGYNLQSTIVGASTANISGLEDSRAMVKWALDNKKENVSPVYQDKKQSYIAALAIDDIFEEYIPATFPDVKESIRIKLLNNKKAQKLMDEYKGKANDLAGYASLLGTEVTKMDVVFASPMFGHLGYNEAALQGQVAAAKKGELVGPVQGNTRIVVFTVDGVDTEGRNATFEERSAEFDRTCGYSALFNPQNILNVLRGASEVTNYSPDFENPGL